MSNIFDINPTNQPKQKIQLDINQTTNVTCSACNGMFFEPVLMFKKVSALLSPTGKEAILPIESYACKNCGNINKEFLPNNFSNEE
jgi:predicted nucleic acid-binding Zn ribbon protein